MMILGVIATSVGCTESNTDQDPNAPSAKFVLGEPGTYDVEITLTSNLVSDYAYTVTTDMDAVAPAPVVLFAEGTTGEVTEDVTSIKVSSLEGSTEYKIFICAKYSDSLGYGEVVELGSFTTADYSDFVTILPSDDMFSIKMYIEVPEGKTIAYTVMDLDDYNTWMGYGTFYDAYFLSWNKDIINAVTESQVVVCSGDSTFAPGQAVRVIVAEVEDGPIDAYDRETYRALFDVDSYAADFTAGTMKDADDYWTTEYHFSETANVAPPETVDNPVGCEILSTTTQTATLSFTKPEGVEQYVYSIYETSGWDYVISQLGYDGAIFFATMYPDDLGTDDMVIEATGLQQGLTYKAILIGNIAGSDGTKISVNIVEFAPSEPTKPAPELTVTAIDAPEGEEVSPFVVWFNIKCDSQDATYIKYLCNDYRSWLLELNSGSTYTSLMNANGNIINNVEVIEGINSDEGYNIYFSSLAETETCLVVVAGNDEYSESSAEDESARASNTTIAIPDAELVDSDLFTSLLGSWTATAYVMILDDNGNYALSSTPNTGTVKISSVPEYPETLTDEVYAAYHPKMTIEQVDSLYEQFKVSSAKFEKEVRGQNRLLCEGSIPGNGNFAVSYSSPYDLFYDENYTVAVTTDDIFKDFGPKWFLEIREDDEVVIPIDPTIIPSFYGYNSTDALYQYAIDPVTYSTNTEITEFAVKVSEDRNTITLLPKYYDFVQYYYSAGYSSMGYFFQMFMCKDLVLTRNTTDVTGVAPHAYTKFKNVETKKVSAKSYDAIVELFNAFDN